MTIPSAHDFALATTVQVETSPLVDRLILWVPRNPSGVSREWERIGSLAGAEVRNAGSLNCIPASSIVTATARRGLLAGFLTRRRTAEPEATFRHPGGFWVQATGKRQHKLLLVWPADRTGPLTADQIERAFTNARAIEWLGQRLALLRDVELASRDHAPTSDPQATATAPDAPSAGERTRIEALLDRARDTRDVGSIALTLIDLGAVHLRQGRAAEASQALEEALELASKLGDSTLQADALLEFGLAMMALRNPSGAIETLDQALSLALKRQDPFAEKLARDRLGLAFSSSGDPSRALAQFQLALELARSLRDRRHEAYLLWYCGIQHAALGSSRQAADHAASAVTILRAMGNPEGAWFDKHYRQFLESENAGLADLATSQVSTAWTSPPKPDPGRASATRILAMAASATTAMRKFVSSGFATVPPAVHETRLKICGACPHHTGSRCRLCGCFTGLKTRLPHESCPIGSWPARRTAPD